MSERLRVLVVGAGGRMGLAVVAAVESAEDLDLVARVDPALPPAQGTYANLAAALVDSRPDVAVDFTQPHTVFENVRQLLGAGVHAVVGTTGLTTQQVDELRRLSQASGANVLIAPNFAIGAVLMMRFAAEASHHMSRAEIIELHHDQKLDAPSGTALRTAGLMEGEVAIHSVRLPGMVAHQEVILGGVGETLTIRHDSLNRESFMPGVLSAVRAVPTRPGLTLGLEPVLFGED